ncbi:MAG: hypothetical protein J0626_07025, partial [Rhodospirillaceae bacterium]|nr:hypothetical protein [Rhodospirillaceae bacterium]
PGSEFETSDMKSVKAFSEILQENGYAAPIRMPRGRDILAACGQLRSESLREKASLSKMRMADEPSAPPHHHQGDST